MTKFFNDLPLHEEIKTTLESAGFTITTEVQSSVIPEFMKRDVIVQSQTGSGKTLSYLLPILNHLYSTASANAKMENKNNSMFISALIIAPTRELCIQIDEILKIFKFRSEIFIGGTKIDDDLAKIANNSGHRIIGDIKSMNSADNQINRAKIDQASDDISSDSNEMNEKDPIHIGDSLDKKQEPDCIARNYLPADNAVEKYSPINIAIGTPGRLQEIISSNSKVFSRVKFVVLDESDKLLSFGFEAKLLRILQFLPKNRLTGLFSATINESVTKLSLSFLKNPASIKVTEQIPDKLSIKYAVLSPKQKLEALVELIINRKSIVFFSTCNTVDYFYELYSRIFKNSNDIDLKLHKIHGKMDQRDRNQIYSGFETAGGSLFCTDVAARGIDFKNVDVVVHFDFPKDYENIVHRSGRTARNGHSGHSVIFLMPNEKSVIDFLKLKGISVEPIDETVTSENFHFKGNSSFNENNTSNLLNNEPIDFNTGNNLSNSLSSNYSSHDNSIPIETSRNNLDRNVNNERHLSIINRGKNVMDKSLLDISVRSFVSYVRGYKEHILNYILNYKELDFDELAEIHFLEKIPSMTELKNVKFKNFDKPEVKANKKFKGN